jgi:hypothetical protein
MKADHEQQAQESPNSIMLLQGLLARLLPSVPDQWWKRPGAPRFQIHQGSNRPDAGPWTFQWDLEQVDGGDVGDLRYTVRHAETEFDLTEPQFNRARKWRMRPLSLSPIGKPVELELRFWWDGGERCMIHRWETEDEYQRGQPRMIYG